MTVNNHISSLLGLPIQEVSLNDSIKPGHACKIRTDWDDKNTIVDYMNHLLLDPQINKLTALVVGMWGEPSDSDPKELCKLLAENASKLESLRAIFMGDIVYEECEMSWIENCDQSGLIHAYPLLEEITIRGGNSLRLSNLQHQHLKKLVVQTGGMGTALLNDITSAKLPNLEHLELWLGTDDYGWDCNVSQLEPITNTDLFPNLRYLGLKNSIESDFIAELVSDAPILDRLSVLDLSMGTLGDQGAGFLLESKGVHALQALHLDHHYMSDEMVKKLQALDIEVTTSEKCESDDDGEDEWRYVEVGE